MARGARSSEKTHGSIAAFKKKEFFSAPSYKHNLSVLNFTRTVASVVAGVLTGILGVSAWKGFLVYFIFHILDSGMLVIMTGFDAKKYYGTWMTPLTSMVFTSSGILSFLLFWIIFYNIAHVF